MNYEDLKIDGKVTKKINRLRMSWSELLGKVEEDPDAQVVTAEELIEGKVVALHPAKREATVQWESGETTNERPGDLFPAP